MTVTFYGRPVSPPPAPDFTIVAIPDTQHYVDDRRLPADFSEQTQWIVDTRTTLNTEFVTHLGDIVENIDPARSSGIRAERAHGHPGQRTASRTTWRRATTT